MLAEMIASKLAKGRVEKVPDTRHFMPMEGPREIASKAVDLL